MEEVKTLGMRARTCKFAVCIALACLAGCAGDIKRINIGAPSITTQASVFGNISPRMVVSGQDPWRGYHIERRAPLEYSFSHETLTLFGTNGASGAWTLVDIHPSQEPLLTWEWSLRRAGDLPEPLALMVGFDVDESEVMPDVLAWARRVEETLGVRPPLRSIGYVFGGNEHPDIAESAFFSPTSVYLINLRPPEFADGRWYTEVRDIAGDYRAVFKQDAPRVKALAFMGDARGRESRIEARLRNIGVYPSSLLQHPELPVAQSVTAIPNRKWPIIAGVAALVCTLSGLWLVVMVTRRMRAAWASRRLSAVNQKA